MTSPSARVSPEFCRTKIVATLGPASEGRERIRALIEAGVDVFRINTAHGTLEEHQKRADDIRAVSSEMGCMVGILVDLAGPKMRLGELIGGAIECHTGDVLRFVRGEKSAAPDELVTTYEPLLDELKPNDRIRLADGVIELLAEKVENHAAVCRVTQGGTLRSRQGINLPGVKLRVAAMSERDEQFAIWAAKFGVEYVSLSFVRAADDIIKLKKLIKDQNSASHVVAKIEKPEALDCLEAIVEATDAVMVARGDLGVEIDIAQVPIAQKRIIAACRRARKPVIVATQMLDSMQHSRLPTRAEATDVANAILDGADACMLSGESAIGDFPVESVAMMNKIAKATEPSLKNRRCDFVEAEFAKQEPITEATTQAAGELADRLEAKLLIVASSSGVTARCVAESRHFVPVLGLSDSEATLRKMALYWGVLPLAGAPTADPVATMRFAVDWGTKTGVLTPGDRVVLVIGTGITASNHNAIVVHVVK